MSNTRLAKIELFVFVVAATAVLALTAAAAPIGGESVRPRAEWREMVPAWPEISTQQKIHRETVAIYPWSKLVYQSFRDNNWEIYISDDDGLNLSRLTYDNAPDIHPRLNRGATQIVFASERDGDYELYTMNRDGSGLVQLTANTADDVYPVWSPDGTKIAFQSYRDGQPEIYVINADGSGQTRLTADADFDGYPTWSPDGTKIAFTSRRTGSYRIYVMTAEGGAVTLLSTQPYSLNPTWSPDGTKIAYDADLDGDGWQELWVMNADGSNQQLVYDPPSEQDAWAHSWSPDSRFVAFTTVSFIYYQGTWYWRDSYIKIWDSIFGFEYNMFYAPLNWHPDWQTTDNIPPTSNVAPLSEAAQYPGVEVTWGGNDENSGLAVYDVQYRVGSEGAWQDWQTGTISTTAFYTATPGATVYFRSRAHDHSLNIEAWPTTPDTHVTFYSWELRGRITDNRGLPLPGASVSITPTPLTQATADLEGNFRSKLVAYGAHTLDVVRSGYGNVAASTVDQDVITHLYLPTPNNLISNGNFEGAQPLAQWQTGGTLPISATTLRHTGAKAASLGSRSCSHPCLTYETASIRQPASDMVVDSLGNVHVVSVQNNVVTYTTRSTAGIWSTSLLYTGAQDAALVASNDQIHLLAIGGRDLYRASRSLTGTWSSFRKITTLPDIGWHHTLYVQNAVVDQEGKLHILITNMTAQTAFYLRQVATNTWSLLEMPHYNMIMGIGPDGTLHFAWRPGDVYPKPGIYYQSRLPNGSWTNAIKAPEGGFEILSLQALDVAPDGTVHILGIVYQDMIHIRRSPDGMWSTDLVYQGAIHPSDQFWTNDMAVDSQGNVHALLWDTTAVGNITYAVWHPETGWQAVHAGDGSYTPPVIAVDAYDQIHTFVVEGSSAGYGHSSSSTTAGTAELAQTVTIPADMQFPTLSFMGRRFGDLPGDGSGLELVVSDNMTTTVVPIPAGGASWKHYWVDMSPWAGQTVTIKFKLTQEAGAPSVQFLLDDVSLSSAHPDTWLTLTGTPSAFPNGEITFSLTFGNRGYVEATNGAVSLNLPSQLTFVSATITPTLTTPSLVWEVGDLAADSLPTNILVTAVVKPTAALWTTVTTTAAFNTATAELETLNNSAEVVTFIGNLTYLPAVVNR